MRLLPTLFASSCAILNGALASRNVNVNFNGLNGLAPLIIPPNPINNSYIVVFKANASSEALQAHHDFVRVATFVEPFRPSNEDESGNGSEMKFYEYALRGYSGYFAPNVLEQIRAREEVEYVEMDQVVQLESDHRDRGGRFVKPEGNIVVQQGPTWGLARLCQRAPVGEDLANLKYNYDARAGTGSCAYILDSGVDITHPEFEGRAHWGTNCINNSPNSDEHGHGTHVAGTIGSNKWGVAKKTTIIAVKTLDGNGRGGTASILGAVDWVLADWTGLPPPGFASASGAGAPAPVPRAKSCPKGVVINISITAEGSRALSNAVHKAIRNGISVVSSTGNYHEDGCKYSPSNIRHLISVGSVDAFDTLAGSSNWGKCVTIHAPGVNIVSASNKNHGSQVNSGTSMASPHAAGLVAYLASVYPDYFQSPKTDRLSQIAHRFLPRWITGTYPFSGLLMKTEPTPRMNPGLMYQTVLHLSTKDILKGLHKTTPNRMIYNGVSVGGGAGVEPEFWREVIEEYQELLAEEDEEDWDRDEDGEFSEGIFDESFESW